MDEPFEERRANCGTTVDNAGHASKMPFSEDLPTPRLVACLDHTMVVVSDEVNPDPDMNNALADSDDDETSTDSQGGNNHPDSALAVNPWAPLTVAAVMSSILGRRW